MLFGNVLLYVSCKKENSCEGCIEHNKPPIAVAGPDQVITLPTDSISLDGSASSDPDGTISFWLWKKVSGPVSFTFVSSSSAKTNFRNLVAGIYQIELSITDNDGLMATDTMQVVVIDPAQPNRTPVANAGQDQTIVFPNNSVMLDGNGSTDPDNNITTYLWSKISGPLSFAISNKDVVKTGVTFFAEGTYEFELKVTDAGGLSSTDTVQIGVVNSVSSDPCLNRPMININFLHIGYLSQARAELSSGTAGGKILFAGGWVPGHYSSRVDIYDIATNTWSTAALTVPEREGMTVASVGNKILFAGGGDNDNGLTTSRVDIYNAVSNTWSIAELSLSRQYLASATLGNKVFFSGGNSHFTYSNIFSEHASDRIDIYDNATNTWSIDSLSTRRDAPSATTISNKIYFAGGSNYDALSNLHVLNSINVYDGASGTWSVSSFQGDSRMRHASIAFGNKIFWASGAKNTYSGGLELSNNVEILDIATGITSFACMIPKQFFRAVTKNEYIIFFTGKSSSGVNNKVDIYNTATDTWYTGLLPFSIYSSTIISANNTLYVAGGVVNGVLSNQVWKLEF